MGQGNLCVGTFEEPQLSFLFPSSLMVLCSLCPLPFTNRVLMPQLLGRGQATG